jgi:hypothetical protein
VTVTVTPTVEPSTGYGDPHRVRLDVADSGALVEVTVTRLDPDGRTVVVRTTDGNPLTLSAGVGLVYDYEAPFGAPVSYSTFEDSATVSSEVTVVEDMVWLIHPGVPEISMPISVASFGARGRPVARGVFRPMGRKTAVVQTDGQRKSFEGVIELNTFTLDEILAFETLTDDAADLLLNVPVGLGWGVPTCYVSLGDLEEGRLVDYAAEPRRLHTLSYVVVDRPVGGTQAERTYLDLLVSHSSYAELPASYGSYFALLAGP